MSTSSRTTHTFDYIVVGGGSAGVVVAARLAEDADCSVCLVEFGATDEGRPQVMNLKSWPEMMGSEFDYDYTIEPQPRGNGNIRHSRAKILGGCSSHNSCIAFRAPNYDLDNWVKLGAKGWGVDGTRKYYEKVLEKVNIENVQPGLIPVQDAMIATANKVVRDRIFTNMIRSDASSRLAYLSYNSISPKTIRC